MTSSLIEKRQIRIFISSTFRDMMAERNYLMHNTFPSLRKYCAERDVLLQEIDLRWGITEEESKQGKVVDICLKEIQNSSPFFIGILGDRYGWVPNESEQENIKNTGVFTDKKYSWVQDKLREGTSITEIEIQDGVLRSEEEVHAYFYFRSPGMEVPDDYREQPGSAGALKLERLKQNIREQKKYPVSEYESVISLGEKVESSIKSLVNKLFIQFTIDKHVNEQNEQKAFIRSRTGVYIPDAELNTRLDQFAGSKESGLLITGDSGTGKSALLANWIQNRGTRNNEKTIYHFIGQSRSSGKLVKVMRWLEREILCVYGAKKTYGDQRWTYAGFSLGLIPLIGIPVFGGPVIKFFVLRIIVGLIAGIITSLLGIVILYAQGWGLSALALLLGSIAFGKYAGHPIKIGLIGSVAGLIVWRIGTLRNADESAKEYIKRELQEILFTVQKYGRLFIVLDGLDKFSDDKAKYLKWLPYLSENVKLILSTVKDSALKEYYKNINYQIIEMPAPDAKNRKELIKNYLAQYRKSLAENQAAKLAGNTKTENPLVLIKGVALWGLIPRPLGRLLLGVWGICSPINVRLSRRNLQYPAALPRGFFITILDELRMFGKFEELDAEIERYLAAETIQDLYQLVLERLEDSNSGKKEFVKEVFSLLYVSQKGLCESEILEITGNKPLYWTQLFNGMTNHLIIRGDKVAFAHNFIRDAVKTRYLPRQTGEKQYREKLTALMLNDSVSDSRKYDELCFQYFELEKWDELYNFLLDFSAAEYLLKNDEDSFSKYWRGLYSIDKQNYRIEKYLDLETEGRNPKDTGAFFINMSVFVNETLSDSSASAKFAKKSGNLANDKKIQ